MFIFNSAMGRIMHGVEAEASSHVNRLAEDNDAR